MHGKHLTSVPFPLLHFGNLSLVFLDFFQGLRLNFFPLLPSHAFSTGMSFSILEAHFPFPFPTRSVLELLKRRQGSRMVLNVWGHLLNSHVHWSLRSCCFSSILASSNWICCLLYTISPQIHTHTHTQCTRTCTQTHTADFHSSRDWLLNGVDN